MRSLMTILAMWMLTSLAAPRAVAADVPRNLDELWAGFDPRRDPLEIETLKEWQEGDVVCRVVRFQVGVFKGAPSRVAAFYAFPKGAERLPALLSLHGGGQSASLDGVVGDARRGYAALSLNWGGNKLNFGRSTQTYDGPQTDWGRLDATHPPQRNKKHNHFAGPLGPDEFTLDDVESPRNSNWFLVLVAARRALTFLERQAEVDPARLGVYGHSMGGKLTTNLAGIDPRVKAAVPSCGGGGIILESQVELPGCVKKSPTALELACVADNAYIPRIVCPILWLSPTNDFHAPVNNMAWNWRDLPDERTRFSISPHLNHRHTPEHQVVQHLWFEQHLKGAWKMPRSPQATLNLKTADGVPTLVVAPDLSLPVARVDVYYSTDPHELTRFWCDAAAVRDGDQWLAACPLASLDQPLFAFADVFYEMPERFQGLMQSANNRKVERFAISSRVRSASSAELKTAGVKATDEPRRMIDDGSRGWHDWYQLSWDHPPLWSASTRKLKDVRWRGPDRAKLAFEMKPAADCTLVVTVGVNAWGAFSSRSPALDYTVAKQLQGGADWQTVEVSLDELVAVDPKNAKPLADWRWVTELSLSPSGETVLDGRKQRIGGRAWSGPRDVRNLRWIGGEYPRTKQVDAASASAPEDQPRAFNAAIQKSLDEEKKEERKK